jgi:hypothetical protein
MEKLIPIGKMAKMNKVSIQTLRLYDEWGILKPKYVDESTGYRYYSTQQNSRLYMIIYMKELGMSLNEILEVFQKEDIAVIEEILGRKNEQLHEQMRKMKEQHDAVERAILSLERLRKSPKNGTFSLEYIDRRFSYGLKCEENFYEKDVHSYEICAQKLRDTLSEQGLLQINSYNIGTSIKKNNFLAEKWVPDEIFILNNRELSLPQRGKVIDSGMYACVYLDNYDEEIDYLSQLLTFCQENEYEINGDYICEVLSGFNVFENSPNLMNMRLQIPVIFHK